jgi:sensor histidine kinase YesM
MKNWQKKLMQGELSDEQLKGARMSVWFRWAFISLVTLLLLTQLLLGYRQESLHAFILVAIYFLSNTALWYAMVSRYNPWWLGYLSAVLDIGVICSHLFIMTSGPDPMGITSAATLFLIPIIFLLYTFRLDRRLMVFLVVVALIGFNFVYFINYFGNQEFYLQSLSTSPTSQLFKSAYLLFTGLLCIHLQRFTFEFIDKQVGMEKELTKAQSRVVELQKENLQSQFEVLKQQVNPHFLFNSLNVLSSLIKVEPDLAEAFTEKLSKVYRYVLENKEKDMVPLSTELDFMNSYVFLLNIRFMGKISVIIDINEARSDLMILPMALQLLIENAIKHNTFSKSNPLNISINIDSDNFLVIRNNTQIRETQIQSTGVGLANITNRYRLISEREPVFEKTETEYIAKVPLIAEE